jgi:hypothetical protein
LIHYLSWYRTDGSGLAKGMDSTDKSNQEVVRDIEGMHKYDWWGLEVVRVFSVTRGSHVIGSWGRKEVLVHIGYQRFARRRLSKIELRVDQLSKIE